MSDHEPYRADPKRAGDFGETGIFIRGIDVDGKWGGIDLADLDKDSVTRWLRSRGGDNPWAENTVLILLGHPVSRE